MHKALLSLKHRVVPPARNSSSSRFVLAAVEPEPFFLSYIDITVI